MNRRGFMRSMLALGVAPAVVSSGVLMRIKPLLLPTAEEVISYGVDVGRYEPVNFVLMRALLEAARKKLPYFNGTLQGEIAPPDAVHVRWERVNFSKEVCMSYAG